MNNVIGIAMQDGTIAKPGSPNYEAARAVLDEPQEPEWVEWDSATTRYRFRDRGGVLECRKDTNDWFSVNEDDEGICYRKGLEVGAAKYEALREAVLAVHPGWMVKYPGGAKRVEIPLESWQRILDLVKG